MSWRPPQVEVSRKNSARIESDEVAARGAIEKLQRQTGDGWWLDSHPEAQFRLSLPSRSLGLVKVCMYVSWKKPTVERLSESREKLGIRLSLIDQFQGKLNVWSG